MFEQEGVAPRAPGEDLFELTIDTFGSLHVHYTSDSSKTD